MNYTSIMKRLGVPALRQDPTPLNARWFMRNEAIKHHNNPLYAEAMRAAQEVLASEK